MSLVDFKYMSPRGILLATGCSMHVCMLPGHWFPFRLSVVRSCRPGVFDVD